MNKDNRNKKKLKCTEQHVLALWASFSRKLTETQTRLFTTHKAASSAEHLHTTLKRELMIIIMQHYCKLSVISIKIHTMMKLQYPVSSSYFLIFHPAERLWGCYVLELNNWISFTVWNCRLSEIIDILNLYCWVSVSTNNNNNHH